MALAAPAMLLGGAETGKGGFSCDEALIRVNRVRREGNFILANLVGKSRPNLAQGKERTLYAALDMLLSLPNKTFRDTSPMELGPMVIAVVTASLRM